MTFTKFLAAAGLRAGNNWLCRVGSSSFPPSAGTESGTATGTSSQGGLLEHVQTQSKACRGGKLFYVRWSTFRECYIPSTPVCNAKTWTAHPQKPCSETDPRATWTENESVWSVCSTQSSSLLPMQMVLMPSHKQFNLKIKGEVISP